MNIEKKGITDKRKREVKRTCLPERVVCEGVGSGVGTEHEEDWDAGITGFEVAGGDGVESGIRCVGSWVCGICD
jgi:hypothetical protein